jgi:hypothetical protein
MPISSTLANPHGATSTTYTQPPLDGSLTVPEIYDWHFQHNPDHVLFVYSNHRGERTEITWKQGVHAIHRAGRLLAERLSKEGLQPEGPKAPVIAIFAATGNTRGFISPL